MPRTTEATGQDFLVSGHEYPGFAADSPLQVPLQPVFRLYEALCGFNATDSDEIRIAKLQEMLHRNLLQFAKRGHVTAVPPAPKKGFPAVTPTFRLLAPLLARSAPWSRIRFMRFP